MFRNPSQLLVFCCGPRVESCFFFFAPRVILNNGNDYYSLGTTTAPKPWPRQQRVMQVLGAGVCVERCWESRALETHWRRNPSAVDLVR